MHKKFDHQTIEKKWQKSWREQDIYDVLDRDGDRKKLYVNVEFPYPSGNLHIGHWHAFAVPDIYVRAKRMQGYQVFFPMGFDAFGLPAENAAIKRGLDPREWTESNMAHMRTQLDQLGNSFSWNRTVNTTDPAYYKWTQWMFTQFFEHDIAYRGKGTVNWCPSCNTVLANEQVTADDTCERCGTAVEKREMDEWKLRITQYADRLIDDLDPLEWPEHIKESQRQWIGRSTGAEITFPLNIPPTATEVVFASNNEGKRTRLLKLLRAAGLSVTLKTPKEIGIDDFDVVEDAATLEGNSLKKARELKKHTDLPVLADDTGFFIDGAEIDPVTVKRNALDGKKESELSIEEISTLMQVYYKELAERGGGSIDAEWHNALTYISEDGAVSRMTAVRPVILTNESRGAIDPYLPLRGLYKSKATGKYVLEQTEEEELLELAPIKNALKILLSPHVTVFTTRPDTLYGATYMVLAPEHALIEKYRDHITNLDAVEAYREQARKKDERDRLDQTKEKTGVPLEGITATNPANGEEIPVYIADYVLASYGTGAIMAVPAHDDRDLDFALKFDISIQPVIAQVGSKSELVPGLTKGKMASIKETGLAHTGSGLLINSGEFDGMESESAKVAIIKKVGGRVTNTYRLRDWSVGRQRYWGVPIPIVYDPEGKAHAIPKEHLPWLLPTDVDPTPTGEPPLAKSKELLLRTERIFGAGWRPEVETMDTFVDSSWYFLRYCDPQNENEPVSKEAQKDWMPIDLYFGGAEHTTMHLLYSRFWQKALFDLRLAEHQEPYKKRINRGLILGPDGNKMSKSKGNVIDPDEQVQRVGADTVKMYLAFMGPYGEVTSYPWDMGGIAGIRRFLERAHGLSEHIQEREDEQITKLLHKTIDKVTRDVEQHKFNTAISALMVFVNVVEKNGFTQDSYLTFLRLLAPFAPHLTEELWCEAGNTTSIHSASWPTASEELLIEDTVTIGVQINGKVRGDVTLRPNASEDEAISAAHSNPQIDAKINGATVRRVIYKPGKILNFILE